MNSLQLPTVFSVVLAVSVLLSSCTARSPTPMYKAEEKQSPVSAGTAQIPISPEEEKHLADIWARAGKAVTEARTNL